MGNQLIAKFYIMRKVIDVYACWDKDTPEGEFDFFDIYDHDTGLCLNEGDPFYEFPTYNELFDFLREVKEYI